MKKVTLHRVIKLLDAYLDQRSSLDVDDEDLACVQEQPEAYRFYSLAEAEIVLNHVKDFALGHHARVVKIIRWA